MRRLAERIAREPVAIGGVLMTAYGVLVAFGVLELSREQIGSLTAFGGAFVFALRWLVTPSAEVVAQQKPGELFARAGHAALIADGAPVVVHRAAPPPH